MKTIFMSVALGAVASGLIGGIAVAQKENTDEITVLGTRMVTAKVAGKTASGIPISDVSLGYGVILKDLNLASQASFLEAQKRVKDAAGTACKELSRRYPNGSPSEAECTKAAVDKAMIVLEGWAALASKASGK